MHTLCVSYRPVTLAESQLQAFSVARRLVMFSAVLRTCRDMESMCNTSAIMGTVSHYMMWFIYSCLWMKSVKKKKKKVFTHH